MTIFQSMSLASRVASPAADDDEINVSVVVNLQIHLF